MIQIPPETQITSTLKPGSVYYFLDRGLNSAAPHYFIVLNADPVNDSCLLLAVASSQIEKVTRQHKYTLETLVYISLQEYPGFSKDSVVNCNQLFPRTIRELAVKLECRDLKRRSNMDIVLVEKLRAAAIASHLVPEEHKDMLRC